MSTPPTLRRGTARFTFFTPAFASPQMFPGYATEKRKFRIHRGPLRGSSSPLKYFEPARVKPIQPKSASFTTSAFDRPYASSPATRPNAELGFSPAVARGRGHHQYSSAYAYPLRDGQDELAWVAWVNTKMVCPYARKAREG